MSNSRGSIRYPLLGLLALSMGVAGVGLTFASYQKVFADTDKVILDEGAGGAVPYLPLNELRRMRTKHINGEYKVMCRPRMAVTPLYISANTNR